MTESARIAREYLRGGCAAGLWLGLILALVEGGLGIGLAHVFADAQAPRPPGAEYLALSIAFWIAMGFALGAVSGAFAALQPSVPSRRAAMLAFLVGGAIALDLILLCSARGVVKDSLWWRYQTPFLAVSLLYAAASGSAAFVWARKARNPLAFDSVMAVLITVAAPIWLLLALKESSGVVSGTVVVIAGFMIGSVAVLVRLFAGVRSTTTRVIVGGLTLTLALLTVLPFLGNGGRARTAPVDRSALPANAAPVIVIVLDTVRADHLGTYGGLAGLTPAIDALSEHATVFENAVSTSPWTAPAHASILTGLLPHRHGVRLRRGERGSTSTLSLEFETLSERFRAAGYATGAVVANPWLSRKYHFDQGFDDYRDEQPLLTLRSPAVRNFAVVLSSKRALAFLTDPIRAATHGSSKPYVTADGVFDSALDVLDRLPVDRPPFLFLNLMDAHDPFDPPPPFSRLGGEEAAFQISYHDVVQKAVLESRISAKVLDQIRSSYAGEIAYLDSELDRFLDALQSRGLYQNAWIVITSDHGEHLGEDGLYWHRTSLYDSLVRVPLIVKKPQQSRTHRETSVVQVMDLYPTLLEGNGLDVPAGLDAVGLDAGREYAVAELYADDWVVGRLGEEFDRDLWSVSSEVGRLVRSDQGTLAFAKPWASQALEYRDTDRLTADVRDLYEHLAELELDRARSEQATKETPVEESLSDDELQQLRALGYMD